MLFWDSFSLEDNDRTCVQYRCETLKRKKTKKRWKVYLFVLWSKLICNKNQFSRFKWALLKNQTNRLSKILFCQHRSSFTKISWHRSTTLIATCPIPLLIIHCGIDPQRGMGGFGKIGLFCSTSAPGVSFSTRANFTVIYVEKRQRGLILPCIWIVTEIVVVTLHECWTGASYIS